MWARESLIAYLRNMRLVSTSWTDTICIHLMQGISSHFLLKALKPLIIFACPRKPYIIIIYMFPFSLKMKVSLFVLVECSVCHWKFLAWNLYLWCVYVKMYWRAYLIVVPGSFQTFFHGSEFYFTLVFLKNSCKRWF